jgi:hypothetical protein
MQEAQSLISPALSKKKKRNEREKENKGRKGREGRKKKNKGITTNRQKEPSS